jgi:exopolysaccharide biosynthesis protein
MGPHRAVLTFLTALFVALPFGASAATFSDVTSSTYERSAINQVIASGWMKPLTATTFGYGVNIAPDEWLYMLMFLRTSDACPEFGTQPNVYWTAENIRSCLAGAGVPVATASPTQVRRDEAMQQLFSLRRQSFAFQQLQAKPAGFVDPADMADIPANRVGAMIAAARLKLLFRSNNKLLPASPLLREDAALSVTRFHDWENQGGVDEETNDKLTISKDAVLDHWRDLDTDIYVISVKIGGDTEIRPILPYRSFKPSKSVTSTVRDEFVYEPVSALAKESGALAAVNGSYFNVQWPWGALEDVAIVDGKTVLSRTDRSTFIVCTNGKMYVSTYNAKQLKAVACTPKQALGAGPLFMSKGLVLTQSTKEGFDEYTQWERRVGSNARTAVAVSSDHKTGYIIAVAGKSYPAFGRGGSTLGAFLKSKYPDIGDAMMFDGGGSTALFAKGRLLVGSGESGNTTERSVVSALGVFSKIAELAAQKAFKAEQAKRWDSGAVVVKTAKPTKAFAWQTAKKAKGSGLSLTLVGSRGSAIKVVDAKDNVQVFNVTFDLVAYNATSGLTIARREGAHEKGWKIPTELHVFNPKDGSDTDIIKLFSYIPAAQKPDLKTFDALSFGKTGIFFADATGRSWYYYAKDRQISPATFTPPKPVKKVTPVKK